MSAKAGDRAVDGCFRTRALANFTREIAGETLVGLLAHHAQRLVDFVVGDNIQKWGLREIDGERLLQRVVENGIAGGVGEIRDDDGIALGEFRGSPRMPEVKPGGEQQDGGDRSAEQELRGPRLGGLEVGGGSRSTGGFARAAGDFLRRSGGSVRPLCAGVLGL